MTVRTFSFTYSGGIEDWVVPFHTGTIRLDRANKAGMTAYLNTLNP